MQDHAWDGESCAGGTTRAERGATAVEFAIVVSLLITLLFGIIQFSIAYNRVQGLHAAGREGARLGAVSQTTIAQIKQRVLDSVSIVNASNHVDPCPNDPKTLAVETFCINVFRRDTSASTPTLLTGNNYSPSLQPCNLASGKTVIATVYYKMPLSIPLWPSGVINAQGSGEFRCES